MSLGANDALGIPSNKGSIYPCRIKTGPIGGTSTAGGNYMTVTALLEDRSNGQIQWVSDANLGDRFYCKQSGVYTIVWNARHGTLGAQIGIARNVPAYLSGTSPVGLQESSIPSQSNLALTNARVYVASYIMALTVTTWMDEGDYFMCGADNNNIVGGSADSFISVEKIGG